MPNQVNIVTISDAVVYKLTDKNMRTYKGYQWEQNEEKTAPGIGPLCTNGWFHAYPHPDLAILLNPIHANYQPCRLFKGRACGKLLAETLKLGVSKLTLNEELTVPRFTRLDLTAWAILVVRSIPLRKHIPIWEAWADEVLQTHKLPAADAAYAAAYAADAAYAAAYAARAADAAADAAYAAYAADAAADVAAYAADAAYAAADAVADADAWLLKAHRQFLTWRNE